MFWKTFTDKLRRRPRVYAGSPMPWYGDTMQRDLRIRRREENFHLTN